MKGKKLITIISIVCILVVMLCVPAFATVTESDGNGYALYDGVRLPALPSVDSYSYATLDYSGLSNDGSVTSATLWLSTMKLYRSRASNLINIVFKADEAGSVSRYELIIDGSSYSWTLAQTRNYNADVIIIYLSAVDWSNYDIVQNGVSTDTDGAVYLAASDPIPLDGYNIIEWDGDTTGLVSDPDVGYRLASYEYAVDAFAVWNGDTRSVQSTYVGQSPVWVVQSSGATGVEDGSAIVAGNDGTYIGSFSFNGIYAYKTSNYYPSLIAYRTIEAPPDEGGGDDPDDPQPPFGG